MEMKRRHFLKYGAAQAIAVAAVSNGAAANVQANQGLAVRKKRSTLSIMQGLTDHQSTQISVLHDRTFQLRFFISAQDGTQLEIQDIRQIQFENHRQQITKLLISNLILGETYTLTVTSNQTNQILDEREFEALDTNRADLQFAICSCMNDKRHSADIWKNMAAKKPQLLIFVGDSVYADDGASSGIANPAHLWQRYCEAREILEVYHIKKLIPILATWDDHDFGMNDSNSKSYPFVAESQKNFLNFFAQDDGLCDQFVRGPGISSAFKIGKQLLVLMDNRSFRGPNNAKDRYGHWGEDQENWLISLLRSHDGPSFIFNGSQVFPQMIFKESFSGNHPLQFEKVMEELRGISSRILFASGDVHFSEISKIEKTVLGYETFELTSSAIHSFSIPGILEIVHNSRRIAGTGKRNYIMVSSFAMGYGAVLKAVSYGGKGEVLFSRDLSVG